MDTDYILEFYRQYVEHMLSSGQGFGPLVPMDEQLVKEYLRLLRRRRRRRRITEKYLRELEKQFRKRLFWAYLHGYVLPGGLLRYAYPEAVQYYRALRARRRR